MVLPRQYPFTEAILTGSFIRAMVLTRPGAGNATKRMVVLPFRGGRTGPAFERQHHQFSFEASCCLLLFRRQQI